jgi:hypothetical protein
MGGKAVADEEDCAEECSSLDATSEELRWTRSSCCL